MCGANSAIGTAGAEREMWSQVRERLREPGYLMGLMRAVLDGAIEVAVAVAVTPDGAVWPLAPLATPGIVEEIQLGAAEGDGLRKAWIGDDEFDVLVGTDPGRAGTQPLAVLVTPWIVEHLALYARRLWSQR
jgi:hypothetical protein